LKRSYEKMNNEKEETIKIERFEAGDIAKITKALSRLFKQTNNCSEDKAIELEECVAVDLAHICMVVAKTEKARRVLATFINTEYLPKTPDLDYIVRKEDINNKYTAVYSMEYTLLILNVLKHTDDHFKISLKEDFPSVIETEHFKFILAPRIDPE